MGVTIKRLHNIGRVFLGAVTVVLFTILSGCSVISGAVGNAMGNTAGNAMASSMQGPAQQAQFSAVYSQVFFIGGFGLENGQAKVGRLLEWRIDSTDKNGTDSIWADRALLSTEPDGSQWWYLAYRTKEDNVEYAVQLDKDNNPLLLRFKNKDSGKIEEVKYDRAEAQKGQQEMKDNQSASQGGVPAGQNERVITDPNMYSQYMKGQEAVNVGAGTFQTDKLSYSYTDPNDATNKVEYTWWISKELPGVVKYEWVVTKEKNSVKGELVKLQDGFTTPLQP
ncbi:MAG TPA: hypothetical protein VMW73_05390 [Spirochaetia bacterium]|nr:hypothetical protein [Spirochaetia bacterium]